MNTKEEKLLNELNKYYSEYHTQKREISKIHSKLIQYGNDNSKSSLYKNEAKKIIQKYNKFYSLEKDTDEEKLNEIIEKLDKSILDFLKLIHKLKKGEESFELIKKESLELIKNADNHQTQVKNMAGESRYKPFVSESSVEIIIQLFRNLLEKTGSIDIPDDFEVYLGMVGDKEKKKIYYCYCLLNILNGVNNDSSYDNNDELNEIAEKHKLLIKEKKENLYDKKIEEKNYKLSIKKINKNDDLKLIYILHNEFY